MRPKTGEGPRAANPKILLAFQERIYLLATLSGVLPTRVGMVRFSVLVLLGISRSPHALRPMLA